nr:MAG TPA: Sigma-70, region 4 [Caudoviricetes sp.]
MFFDGYTGEEVAKKLQISRQRVHIIKFKALEKIRGQIK